MKKGRNCSPGAISPLFHNFCILILDICVKTRTRISLRDNRLFEITEVEITRVDCTFSKGTKSLSGNFLTCIAVLASVYRSGDLKSSWVIFKFTDTVDYCYLEIEGTIINTSKYPYFDISDL